MLKLFLSSIILLFTSTLMAQVPTEQDCLGAIPVCQDIYIQPNAYIGEGNYPNEIPITGSCPGNCMHNGERNDVWYIFTVQSAGDVSFIIDPVDNLNDDYDWAVYKLDRFKCQDIYDHVNEMQVSCNWSMYKGPTGANGDSPHNCQGSGGSQFNATIPVLEGETFVLNISNYSTSQDGYTLDLSASTAIIYDDVAPELANVQNGFLQCGIEELTFNFSEKVLCSSVQPSDFELDGPGGPYDITSIYGETCDIGGEMESAYTISFDPPIFASGDYSLSVVHHSYIQDLCGNSASSQTLPFTLDLDSPEADAGDDIEIQFLTAATLNGTVSGGSGSYSYSWIPIDQLEDPYIEDPTTVVLSQSTEFTMNIVDDASGCQASDQVLVTVVGGEMSLNTTADNLAVCAMGQSNLSTTASGGSGDYTYTWTSDPPGFTSDISSPSVFPEITTIYYVEVDDGFSAVTDEITIEVYPNPEADAGGPELLIDIGAQAFLDGTAYEGTGPYSFIWEPGAMIDGPNDIEDPTTVSLGFPQYYTLFVTDNNLCESEPSDVLVIPVGDELSTVPQATKREICIGDSTVITANAYGGSETYTYLWTNDVPGWSEITETIEVNPIDTTTYFVEVSDGFTSVSAHIIITVHPLPVVDILPAGYVVDTLNNLWVCVRDTVVLDAGDENNPPEMNYVWSNSWTQQYVVAKTNGNWFDIQDYLVNVQNPVTGCVNKDSLTVIFDFNQCEIGVEERPVIERPVTIHPNPNQGLIYLNANSKINQLEVKMMSLEGRIVWEEEYGLINSDNWEVPVDISHLPKGVYLMSLKADGQVYTLKVVKN